MATDRCGGDGVRLRQAESDGNRLRLRSNPWPETFNVRGIGYSGLPVLEVVDLACSELAGGS